MTNPHILFVDDTASNIHIAQAYLEDLEITIHTAQTGDNAIDIAQRKPIDLIFLDLEMPVLDGFSTARAIRDFSPVPIIAMTGYSEDAVAKKLREMQFNGFLGKPFNSTELIAQINQYCETQFPADGLNAKISNATTNNHRLSDADCFSDAAGDVLDLVAVNQRLKGNTKLIHRILLSFAHSNTHTYKAFCEALDQKDWVIAKRIVHTLKGGGANIGAMELSKLSEELEQCCATRSLPQANQLLALDKIISKTIVTCRAVVNGNTAALSSVNQQLPSNEK
jgi:CheY-like chemotaxis protein